MPPTICVYAVVTLLQLICCSAGVISTLHLRRSSEALSDDQQSAEAESDMRVAEEVFSPSSSYTHTGAFLLHAACIQYYTVPLAQTFLTDPSLPGPFRSPIQDVSNSLWVEGGGGSLSAQSRVHLSTVNSATVLSDSAFALCWSSDNASDNLCMCSVDVTPADLQISWSDVTTAHAQIV